MSNKDTRKNKQNLKRKKDLPRQVSDKDFLDAFLMDCEEVLKEKQSKPVESLGKLNKHGLPFLDDYEFWMNQDSDPQTVETDNAVESEPVEHESEPEEDFSVLLEASLKQPQVPSHAPKPMPLKRRLKRYPPPEADLDLHGFTAVGAQIKARSFISNAHEQGFFTVRIIVGKGLHSEDGPVLPHVVGDLLNEMKKENIVLAYEWEGKKKLKSGAVLVYLKRFDN